MTRRSPWGSVRRLGSGRFQARYRVRRVEHLAPRTFPTKREAHAFLAATRTDSERGGWVNVDAGRVARNEYAERGLRERPLLRPRARELYEGLLRLHVLPTSTTSATPERRSQPQPARQRRSSWARMGHASPRAALIYQHATQERDQAIARALSDAIARATPLKQSSVIALQNARSSPSRS